VIPLGALHFLRAEQPGFFVRAATFLAGALLGLFVVAMEQADFPLQLGPAAARTVPMLVNVGVAAWRSNGDVLATAHSSLSALATAMSVTLLFVAVLVRRARGSPAGDRRLAAQVLLPIAALAGVVAWFSSQGVLQFGSEWPALLGVAAWGGQVLGTCAAWVRHSAFGPDSAEREAQHETLMGAWNKPAALAVVAVLLGLTVVVFL